MKVFGLWFETYKYTFEIELPNQLHLQQSQGLFWADCLMKIRTKCRTNGKNNTRSFFGFISLLLRFDVSEASRWWRRTGHVEFPIFVFFRTRGRKLPHLWLSLTSKQNISLRKRLGLIQKA